MEESVRMQLDVINKLDDKLSGQFVGNASAAVMLWSDGPILLGFLAKYLGTWALPRLGFTRSANVEMLQETNRVFLINPHYLCCSAGP